MVFRRLVATFIDLMLISFLGCVVQILLPSYGFVVGSYLFALFFCKDGFTGQSLGEKIFGLRVVHDNRQVAPLRAFVRNIFYVIWPLELIILVVAKKRIGDVVSKCKVVYTINGTSRTFNWSCVWLTFVLGSFIALILYYVMSNPLLTLLRL